MVLPNPLEYAKAISGGILAGLGVLYVALVDNAVTVQEWVAVAQAALSAFAVVWGLPNAAKKDVVSQQTVTVSTKSVDIDGPAHRLETNGL